MHHLQLSGKLLHITQNCSITCLRMGSQYVLSKGVEQLLPTVFLSATDLAWVDGGYCACPRLDYAIWLAC